MAQNELGANRTIVRFIGNFIANEILLDTSIDDYFKTKPKDLEIFINLAEQAIHELLAEKKMCCKKCRKIYPDFLKRLKFYKAKWAALPKL